MRFPADGRASRVARTAAFLALASALGYAETVLLPAPPLAGVRLGLANVAVVVAMAACGPRPALAVAVGRVIVVGLATGTIAGPASAMGLAGAVSAWLVMAALAAAGPRFGPLGWSVGGAAAHVIAQLAAASALVGSPAPWQLAPFALALALVAGSATGACAETLLLRYPRLVSLPLPRSVGSGKGAEGGAATAGGT